MLPRLQLALTFVLALTLLLTSCVIDPLGPIGKGPQPPPPLSEPQPDAEFAWGISTAAYQYEDPDVKPGDADYFQTDWDLFVTEGKAPEKGDALFSWTHFDKDLAALKKIGVTHYRFSVSWARCEPQPGVYNEVAIRRYADMARQLKEAGIEPVVCLWHFTFPSWLTDKKNPRKSNWLHPLARAHWNMFVDRMVRATSPSTSFYAPQNEPNGQITTAYLVGEWPPGLDLAFGTYWKAIDASVAMFRDAAKRIKEIKPSAKVVSVEALPWWEHPPLDPSRVIYDTMLHQNVDHLDRIYDVCDILGINYYYSETATVLGVLKVPHQHGNDFTSMGWRINPDGLYNEIQRVATRYGKPMMITENGIATEEDSQRVRYIRDHLAAIARAIRDGYDVRGYFAWSLADNYEWHYGYKAHFGLAHMDPKTCDRVLKPSAGNFADFIRKNRTVRAVSTIQPTP